MIKPLAKLALVRPSFSPDPALPLTDPAAAYIGSNDPSDPLLSPILHPKLSALPPVYMTTSNKDPLNDDAYMFKQKQKQEGVDVTLNEYDGYPHFFHMLPHLEASQRFMGDLATAVRGVEGRSSKPGY